MEIDALLTVAGVLRFSILGVLVGVFESVFAIDGTAIGSGTTSSTVAAGDASKASFLDDFRKVMGVLA